MGLYLGNDVSISEAETTAAMEIISLDDNVTVPECLHHMNALPDALRESEYGAGGTLHEKGFIKKQ